MGEVPEVDDLPPLAVGVVEERPAEELERLAPCVHELGQAVAVGVLDLVLGEVVAVKIEPSGPTPSTRIAYSVSDRAVW